MKVFRLWVESLRSEWIRTSCVLNLLLELFGDSQQKLFPDFPWSENLEMCFRSFLVAISAPRSSSEKILAVWEVFNSLVFNIYMNNGGFGRLIILQPVGCWFKWKNSLLLND